MVLALHDGIVDLHPFVVLVYGIVSRLYFFSLYRLAKPRDVGALGATNED